MEQNKATVKWPWRAFQYSMCTSRSDYKLSLTPNYPHTKGGVGPAHTWDLPSYFSLVLMGVSMYKPSSLPPVSMVEEMPRELSAVLLTDWFQMEHKSNSWSMSTLILHTHCTPGFMNTHGTAWLICCPRSGQKWSSHWTLLTPSQAIENQFYLFFPPAWL